MKRIVLFGVVLILVAIGIYFVSRNVPMEKYANILPTPPPSQNSAVSISKGEIPGINFSLPQGYVIHTFAKVVGQPRDMVFTPGGTLLVSIPSQNKVVALVDNDQDGVAESTKIVLSGQTKPHGLAFHNGKLFVAGATEVDRYTFNESNLTATLDKKLFSLSNNRLHDKRSININESGQLFVSVPSSCNVCNENLLDGGSVIVSDVDGATPRIFAKGLRNATFMATNPVTGAIWVSEMGRDNLGDNIPPDEINILKEGGDYGWPNCYGQKVWDREFNKSSQDPCGSTTAPIYEIPAHAAPLGLVFIDSGQFPTDWQGDLMVAYHGSWNRSTPAGFKIVKLDVDGNLITGSADFLTGFLANSSSDDSALARPADLIFDKEGNLYVSDDKGGNVFIIQKE